MSVSFDARSQTELSVIGYPLNKFSDTKESIGEIITINKRKSSREACN